MDDGCNQKMDDACTQREGQVRTELGELDAAIGRLSDTIGLLEQDLIPILQPEIAGKNEKEPQQELVPLAHSVRSLRQGVETQIERLRSIRSRGQL